MTRRPGTRSAGLAVAASLLVAASACGGATHHSAAQHAAAQHAGAQHAAAQHAAAQHTAGKPAPPAAGGATRGPRAAAARKPRLGVSYGDDWQQKLNLYYPRRGAGGDRPMVVYIHGGGWTSGSPNMLPFELDPIQRALPTAMVAAVGYRLAPSATSPAQTRDVAQAMRWIYQRAGRWGVARDKVVLVGWSSGGQLAAAVGLRTKRPVAGLVAFNSPLDLRDYAAKVEASPNTAPSTGAHGVIGAVQAYLGCGSDAECRGPAGDVSPVTYVDADQPPTLVVRGLDDTLIPTETITGFVRQSRRAGADVTYLRQQRVGHEVSWSTAAVRWLRRAVR